MNEQLRFMRYRNKKLGKCDFHDATANGVLFLRTRIKRELDLFQLRLKYLK